MMKCPFQEAQMKTIKKTVKIGLFGTGYMGKCHALAWTAVNAVFGEGPRVVLAHLSEITAELATARAEALGFARASADWRDVIADPEVEVVSITTPNPLHAEIAIAALEAGKHVWCEKPMATRLEDAEAMTAAARRSGRVAVLGYNYIQSPLMRQIGALLAAGAIGRVTHFRIEMDEDFMAAPEAAFGWKSEAGSGLGALDDFGVHPVSLIHTLLGPITRVVCHATKPYAERATADGTRRAVETHDVANVLCELADGASGLIALSRSAWGRKGRIAFQIFGAEGSIVFDQERFNELQLFTREGDVATQGFRTILAGPAHPPYDRFIAAPGHGLGFNDLKTIECHELLKAIAGAKAHVIDFEQGLAIERVIAAMGRSQQSGGWVAVG